MAYLKAKSVTQIYRAIQSSNTVLMEVAREDNWRRKV
jgi:hypothetical protein